MAAGNNPLSVEGDIEKGETEFDGYADYRVISIKIANKVHDAVRAVMLINSLHTEGGSLDSNLVSNAHAQVHEIAHHLRQEMRALKDEKDVYEDILERWGEKPGDDGYLEDIKTVSLYEGCPDWLFQFADDIRTAAWHLGYIQAGRYETKDKEPEESTSVFDDE